MNDETKIEVMLKEFDALRAEVLQRSSQRFHFLTVAGALGAAALFTSSSLSSMQLTADVVAGVAALGIWWYLGNCLARCSSRLNEIEDAVNDLAGTRLLAWEGNRKGTLFRKLHK